MDWRGPVFSDSGGYQLYSLITGSRKNGRIGPEGFTYRPGGEGRKKRFSPENCITKQLRLGADVLFCLDHCTHPDEPPQHQKLSVENTVRWAKLCKETFRRSPAETSSGRLLFAVVQGGDDRDLRKSCVNELLELGFDGFGFGGWPVHDDGSLRETVAYTAELLPENSVKHALGIGKPENLVRAYESGYDIFDCVIPSRDARHRRLYVFNEPPEVSGISGDRFYSHVYIGDRKYVRDRRPLDENCDCPCCRRYSRGYLHHLFRVDDGLAPRLATLHNLRFYTRLMETLRRSD
jgi:queuine tRNA-ribosyltransferase